MNTAEELAKLVEREMAHWAAAWAEARPRREELEALRLNVEMWVLRDALAAR